MLTGCRMSILGILILSLPAMAAEPIESGLKVGQRPGPYTSIVSVGPQRGQLHCFICEAEDRPVVIVFARTPSESLGQLVRGLDRIKTTHKKLDPRIWVTFLNNEQQKFDPQLVAWSKQHNLSGIPLGVFEDLVGPPTYRIHRGADVTVFLSVKQKVVRTFGFKDSAMTEGQIAEILKATEALMTQASN